jgi:hypothetical protein
MEISVLTLVGVGLAAMFFGYFFGLFEGRRQGYKKRKKEEPAPEEGIQQQATPSVPEPAPKTERRSALLELNLAEGSRPQLHIDGREVDATHVSAEQRRRLIDIMVMLKPWVDPGGAASTPPSAAVSKPMPVSPVPTTLKKAESAPATASAPRSLVAQIDSILQARLAGSPLAEKGICLAEALHGGAIVFVGTSQYDGVDAVPDPAIQGAIREAIAEWEEKFTPK